MYVQVCVEKLDLSGAGVTGCCELSDVGAEN